MKVKVIAKLNKRLWPSTRNKPLPHPLLPNDILHVVEEVEGEAVAANNNKWYKIDKGFYVWSGGVVNADVSLPVVSAQALDWWHTEFQIPYLWERLGRGKGIKVAVLDSGIDKSHPYLQHSAITTGNIWNDTSEASDHWGHGTQVSSILVSNGPMFVGVAPDVSLHVIKVFDENGASVNDIVKGLRNLPLDVDIVCISLIVSSLSNTQDAKAIGDAIANLATPLVLSAAGNSSDRTTFEENLPAALNTVMSVAATQQGSTISPNSSLSRNIDLAAPGHNVKCLLPGNSNYLGPSSGTSFAAPFVAGLLALGLSYIKRNHKPVSLTVMKDILLNSVDDKGNPNLYGRGIVNTSKFLNQIMAI